MKLTCINCYEPITGRTVIFCNAGRNVGPFCEPCAGTVEGAVEVSRLATTERERHRLSTLVCETLGRADILLERERRRVAGDDDALGRLRFAEPQP